MQSHVQAILSHLAAIQAITALEEDGASADVAVREVNGETTLDCRRSDAMLDIMKSLRDDFDYRQLTDLAGMDYADHHNPPHDRRYAVVYHLLSLSDNRRLRVRFYCQDDEFPSLPTMTGLWGAAGWYEREAFDLFGIVFQGHEDLRRILTDYGFIGHPFRKDFPLSGHVEMRYDPVQKRVIYQPVTIPKREIVPRVVREEKFAKDDKDG